MHKLLAVTATVLMSALACPSFAEDAAGNWLGAIDGHLISLVHIERAADGRLTGTFASHESPLTAADPHALKSPLSDITATDDHLAFKVPGNGGIFDGGWDDGKKAWTGRFQWGEGGYVSPLALSRTDTQALPEAPAPVAFARPEDEVRALDGLAQAYTDDGRFMGSVVVVQNGKVLLDKGYGFADIARSVPNTPQTAFRIGSITKQFTAAGILLLQERGKLKISDPVSAYLPDAPAAWQHVTLYNLLTHTSGLGDYVADLVQPSGPDKPAAFEQDMTPAQLLAVIREEPLLFEPGSQFKYSNSGYAVLGVIIEKVSGQPYGDFLRDNLFGPADMAASAYDPAPAPDQALGYSASLSGPVPAAPMDPSATFAAGGIVSTTGDLLRWQKALVGGKVLSPASLSQMITPFKSGYGLGVEIAAPFGHTDIRHGGHVSGFRAEAHYEPADGLSVIVLGNFDRDGANALGDGLLAVAHGLPGVLPPRPWPVASQVLAGYSGTYVLLPQLSIVIAYDDGQLTAQATGLPKVAIYAQSETVFYAKELDDTTLEFVTGPDGSPGVLLHRKGQPDLAGRRE